MAAENRFDMDLLTEMRAVETSRSRYQLEHPGAQLEPMDPDVRRLLEALAASSARLRQTTLRNLHTTWRRLLSSYFNFILQPLPAVTMVRAVVTAGMSEATVLPRGTNLRLTTLDGSTGHFRTQAELRIVPIELTQCEIMHRPGGFRLVLSFISQYPRTDSVDLLRMYVHYLDNYLAALRVQFGLQQHLQQCTAVYDHNVSIHTQGEPCEVRFGAYFEEPYEADPQNPLENVRSFFHHPEQDLMINVRVPPPRRAWSRLSLCFDLDAKWPRVPPIYPEIFQLYTVPVINLQRSMAQPILCDGTQDAYPIRFPVVDEGCALHQALGVYRILDEGMEPLRAAVAGNIRPNYEFEERSAAEGGGHALVVRMPEAFAQPQQLVVDATWHQPQFIDHAVGPIRVELLDRRIMGLGFQPVGPVRAPLQSTLRKEADHLLYLLSLKMKPTLEREELFDLLAMFGSVYSGLYRDLPARLRDLAVEVVPDGTLQGAGIRHLYHVMMTPYPDEEEPLVVRFLQRLEAILDAWDYEARAQVILHVGSGPLPHHLKQGIGGPRR